MIEINERIAIPDDEIQYSATRSGGPGGQGVNTTSSRVELTFDLLGSPSLGDREKELAARRLGNRLDKAGVLRLVAQTERSQLTNKRIALERFVELLRAALAPPPPPRKKTRPTFSSRLRRLDAKRRRGEIKSGRRGGPSGLED